MSAEGLSRIELDMADGEGLVPVYCGTADVQDAFHRMAIPKWLSQGCPRFEDFADGQAHES